MRLRARGASALFLLFSMALPVPARAQATGIEDLCRLHGVAEEADLSRIRVAYVEAVQAGIAEDELLPFVEDILRHKLDCGQMVRVLSATTMLRREDLPYSAVFSKVREGVIKEAPPALIVEAAEAKFKTVSASRDVLKSLRLMGYSVRDSMDASIVIASYIERGYAPEEIVSQIRNKGVRGSGFAALSGILEKENPVKRKDR